MGRVRRKLRLRASARTTSGDRSERAPAQSVGERAQLPQGDAGRERRRRQSNPRATSTPLRPAQGRRPHGDAAGRAAPAPRRAACAPRSARTMSRSAVSQKGFHSRRRRAISAEAETACGGRREIVRGGSCVGLGRRASGGGGGRLEVAGVGLTTTELRERGPASLLSSAGMKRDASPSAWTMSGARRGSSALRTTSPEGEPRWTVLSG